MSTVTAHTIYRVPVNGHRDIKEALDATNYTLKCIDEGVIRSAPRRESSVVEVALFDLCRSNFSDNELQEEYDRHGLISTDLLTFLALNETYPNLVSSHPNATHWKDESGNWCWAGFRNKWWYEHVITIKSANHERWSKKWWFVGISK